MGTLADTRIISVAIAAEEVTHASIGGRKRIGRYAEFNLFGGGRDI
jgi:hypothetical protein